MGLIATKANSDGVVWKYKVEFFNQFTLINISKIFQKFSQELKNKKWAYSWEFLKAFNLLD